MREGGRTKLTDGHRGGLGHFAVLFAKALGAEVYVLSHSADKEKPVREMGADHFVNINEKEWYKPYAVRVIDRDALYPSEAKG